MWNTKDWFVKLKPMYNYNLNLSKKIKEIVKCLNIFSTMNIIKSHLKGEKKLLLPTETQIYKHTYIHKFKN